MDALLLSACPSFDATADRLTWHEDWDSSEEADEPPLYLLMADFVRHLTDLNAAGCRDEFGQVFRLIERLLIDGDSYVKELATVSLLEDLQNTNLHPAGSRPEDFIVYLLPVSTWWWHEVELFWEGKVNPIGTSWPTATSRAPPNERRRAGPADRQPGKSGRVGSKCGCRLAAAESRPEACRRADSSRSRRAGRYARAATRSRFRRRAGPGSFIGAPEAVVSCRPVGSHR